MTTKQTLVNLQSTFHTSLMGIFKIAFNETSLRKNWSLIVSILVTFFAIFIIHIFKVDHYEIIIEIIEVIINFLPGILGFTIGGYSLMIGFIQGGILDKITEPLDESKYSLYQKISATFALNIIIQGLSLMIAFLFYFIDYIYINKKLIFQLSDKIIEYVNFLGLFLIIFSFTISLIMIIQVVINIFDFSQLHHFITNHLKIQAAEAAAAKTAEEAAKDE